MINGSAYTPDRKAVKIDQMMSKYPFRGYNCNNSLGNLKFKSGATGD
jgi:hypothetical protein